MRRTESRGRNGHVVVFAVICLLATLAHPVALAGAQESPLRISEFMAANPGPSVDEDDETSDWIEIQNRSGESVSLAGWSLQDSSNSWTFPDVTVRRNGYLLVWASGKDRTDPAGQLHTNFKLRSDGEYLALRNPEGVAVTQFAPAYPNQSSGISYGFDALAEAGFMALATPGFTNSGHANPITSAPTATIGSSFQSGPFTEQLTTTDPDATIHYTLDGTVPTRNSTVAPGGSVAMSPSAPVTTLRTVAVSPGQMQSPVATFTYIHADAAASSVGGGAAVADGIRSLSVVSISTASGSDPANAEVYEPARIDYVDLNGPGFSEEMAMKPSGYVSLRSRKKTFRVNFSSDYGVKDLEYPLFADRGQGHFEPATRFDQLELRGYSIDGFFANQSGLFVSNEYARELTLGLGSLSSHGRAVNVFVDGTYRGLYQLRERINADWMSEYLGGEGDNYESWFIDDVLRTQDLNDGTGEVFAEFNAASNYQATKHLVDARSLINSSLALWFYANYTEKEWRVLGPADPSHPSGLHIIPNDLDLAFGVRYVPGRSDSMRHYLNRFDDDPEFEQILWDQAASAFCDGGAMTVDSMLARFDRLVGEITAAMPGEVRAWNWGSVPRWTQNMAVARQRIVTGQATTKNAWTAKGWFNGCERAPQFDGPMSTLAMAGQPVTFAVEATDPEGDQVTYSASGLPAGVSIAAATGVLSGTPSASGTFVTFVRATDANGRWLESPVTWEILPAALANSPIQLNEVNYVDNSGAWAGNDAAFPGAADNGGDWFELLVVEEGTDLRGWSVDLWDRDRTTGRYKQVETFTFADDARLAALPAGLLVTISEDLAEDATFNSFDDWHINATSSNALAGELLTPDGRSNFDTSAEGIQFVIRAPGGQAAGAPAGLSRSWIDRNGELGPDQVLVTCAVDAINDPVVEFVAEAAVSTFGEPNRCGAQRQDLDAMRDLLVAGDTNCDELTTDADVRALLEFGVGSRSAGDACPLDDPAGQVDTRAADLNGDGVVGLLDALLLARCVQDPLGCGDPG